MGYIGGLLMKKPSLKLFFILVIFAFLVVGSAFASNSEEADVYYINVRIIKIFPHNKGYYVVYKRPGLKTGEVFVPVEWFSASDGRAVMNRVNTRVSPYLSFFIREGKFDRIKIYAPQDLNSPIWGTLQTPKNYDDKFEGVETLELKF